MKKFLITCFVFGLTFFVIDKAFLIVRHYSPDYHADKRLQMILDGKMNKDVLIFGSSRGEHDVTTWMLQDSLGMSAYNLSYGGSSPEYHQFILDMILKYNKKPKYIIKLIDDDFELMYKDPQGNGKGFRYDMLYPLVKYPDVRDELVKLGDKNKVLSQIFVLAQLSKANFDFKKQAAINDTILEFGSKTTFGHKATLDWTYLKAPQYYKSREQQKEIDYLKQFQETCAKNNITLVFATAPIYRETSIEWCKRMKELTLPSTHFYVHDLNDARYKEGSYFGDLSHMNDRGARIYTTSLLNYLKAEVIKK